MSEAALANDKRLTDITFVRNISRNSLTGREQTEREERLL